MINDSGSSDGLASDGAVAKSYLFLLASSGYFFGSSSGLVAVESKLTLLSGFS